MTWDMTVGATAWSARSKIQEEYERTHSPVQVLGLTESPEGSADTFNSSSTNTVEQIKQYHTWKEILSWYINSTVNTQKKSDTAWHLALLPLYWWA